MIKTWQERCEEHLDHEGIVTHQMIMERMQEEIDELRQALAQHVDNVYMSEERVHKTGKSIHEPVGYVSGSGKGAYILLGVDLDDDTPLYTAPPKRDKLSWVGLTDDEYDELLTGDWGGSLIQKVESKLKEKNSA